MDYKKLITVDAAKRGGRPCIRDLRISVFDILESMASGMTTEEIIEDFPELTHQDIAAALAFAADRERQIGNLLTC